MSQRRLHGVDRDGTETWCGMAMGPEVRHTVFTWHLIDCWWCRRARGLTTPQTWVTLWVAHNRHPKLVRRALALLASAERDHVATAYSAAINAGLAAREKSP